MSRSDTSLAARFQVRSELFARVGAEMAPQVEAVVEEVLGALRGGRKLLFCGNGGSAADAQHLAAEYVVRFRASGPPLAALALTTDSSVLTAAANDLGFDQLFARQVDALAGPGDVLFLHSTSGESENLIQAAQMARTRGVRTVGLLARGGGRLAGEVDFALVVPTEETALAQEVHLALGHEVCERVEAVLRSHRAPGESID